MVLLYVNGTVICQWYCYRPMVLLYVNGIVIGQWYCYMYTDIQLFVTCSDTYMATYIITKECLSSLELSRVWIHKVSCDG